MVRTFRAGHGKAAKELRYFTYILRSRKTEKYYIGSTGDLKDRLKRHNGGRSKYTKSGIPWDLVYSEEYGDRSEAVSREREIKSWKSKVRIEKLISDK